MILLVSHRGDPHLGPVLAGLLRRRQRTAILDTGRFPTLGRLDLRLGGAGLERLRVAAGPGTFEAREIAAVWWWRPLPCEPDRRMPLASHREVARLETAAALGGLLRCTRALWVNEPAAAREAEHKVWQLRLARECGLAVPRTCVTGLPAQARAFLREVAPGRAVFKALDVRPETWRETRLVGPEERSLLPLLRHAPVLFQEHVPGVDLRVTCVGRRLFAAEIDARHTSSPHDYRLALGQARVRPARLPAEVRRGLRTLLSRLGLRYGAVDLRRSADGEHLFLEVNPAGQFHFVEQRTGQPIGEALCDLLASG
ncbi:MAG: alpha-L-glutamate ligase [Deltaproteobacteria bacterium]|nr:alpha-L-glutamate ligase [Deltaproteobacteria bacterium]